MRRRSGFNLQPALETIQEYEEPLPPAGTIDSPKSPQVSFEEVDDVREYHLPSPAESHTRQLSPTSSSGSPASPLSPSLQEVEKRLEDAKQNAEENRKNIKSVSGRLGLEIGTKATKNAIGLARLGELSGDLQNPSANSLWQRRCQSKQQHNER